MKKVGIYIHIPFCEKRCHYCSFISCENASGNLIESYFYALKNELIYKSKLYAGYEVDTVYFGGGTPTFVVEKYIGSVMQCIREFYILHDSAEISIECNPDSLLKRDISAYLSYGINRFSVGLQSTDDGILQAIGRLHSFNQYKQAAAALKSCGVTNISTDLMLGLPGQTNADIEHSLSVIAELGIPHVSAYGLKVEQGTKLHSLIKQNKMTLPEDDEGADLYIKVYKGLRNLGIRRYEVSNFAVPGFECRHNLKYWRREEYLGCGAAAHSFSFGQRLSNTENIKQYIDSFSQDSFLQPAANVSELIAMRQKGGYSVETLSAADAEFEYIMLNLRLARGVNFAEFKEKFNADIMLKYKGVFSKFFHFFIITNKSVRFASRGFMVMNGILTEFLT